MCLIEAWLDEPKKRDQKWANNRSSMGSERYRAEAHSLPCFNHTSTLRAWLQLGVHPDLSKESFLSPSNSSTVLMTKIWPSFLLTLPLRTMIFSAWKHSLKSSLLAFWLKYNLSFGQGDVNMQCILSANFTILKLTLKAVPIWPLITHEALN